MQGIEHTTGNYAWRLIQFIYLEGLKFPARTRLCLVRFIKQVLPALK